MTAAGVDGILYITVRAKGIFKMHINDVYVLRDVLSAVRAGMRVDMTLVQALVEAATDEINEFEHRLELMALEEEARQGEMV